MKYEFPDINRLQYHNSKNKFTDEVFVKDLSERLRATLDDFGVKAEVTGYRMNPCAVLFDVVPEMGVAVKEFRHLRLEMEYYLASPVEIVNIGEKQFTIGIAVKNLERPVIGLRDIMESDAFRNNDYILPIACGMNVTGTPFVFDLAATPHILVAGTTGSGKSTFLNSIILSIIYTKTPSEVQFIMIDPKRVEFECYNQIPFMANRVISDPLDAIDVLKWVDSEMMHRYDLLSEYGVKNIDSYNEKVSGDDKLPRIVIIVDEYMDMMISAPKELENQIKRLARLARASGIHLVLATQRPSAKVITSDIKANIPCRGSFTVVDGRESRSIIDRTGAERLLGNGDMLFSTSDSGEPKHIQACYVSYNEIDSVIHSISSYEHSEYWNIGKITSRKDDFVQEKPVDSVFEDELFEEAGLYIIRSKKASIGYLQRVLKIGFNRAARIMDLLADYGVVGQEHGIKTRDILMTEEMFNTFVLQRKNNEE